jgi:hypothetical protein
MHVVHAPKSKEIKFTVSTPKNVPTGHTQHRSGGGKHGDRRTKRLNTRAARFNAATKE